MKEKFKVFIRISSFALVFVIVASAFSLVFMPKNGNKNASGMVKYVTYGYRSEPKNSLDVVFVGNSDLYRGISPMEIWQANGITSYVCGAPMQTPEKAYSILKEMFLMQKPKVVALEVDELFTTSNPTPKKPNANKKKKLSPLQKTLRYFETFDKNIGTKLSYNFPIVKYHNRWDKLELKDFTSIKDSWYFVGRGYLLNNEISPYDGGADYMAEDDGFEDMSEGAGGTLEKILALCEKNGAELMLVAVPSANTWNFRKHNTVEKYAKDNSIEFLDLNTILEQIDFDWKTDTRDRGNHLNLFGGTKVTKKIAEFIEQNYSVEKRNDQSLLNRWKHDFQIYTETKEKLLNENK